MLKEQFHKEIIIFIPFAILWTVLLIKIALK